MSSVDYRYLLAKATDAANEAGQQWVSEHTRPAYEVYSVDLAGNRLSNESSYMLDLCGGAYILIKDRRTKFYKFVKHHKGCCSNTVQIHHIYRGRQEAGLNEACMRAAYNYLKAAGIPGLELRTYID